ncbi:MAG TPA: hypothetical protein VL860_07470 [Planctomycetota bacterium]|nr:hypothetical protein [Planctomycetota bacterium]
MSAPNTPKQPDPVLTHSLSVPLALAALLLMASTLWAMYDEFFGKRPWADYQKEYVTIYGKYLDAIATERGAARAKIEARDDYKALAAQFKAETDAHQAKVDGLQAQLATEIQPRIDDLTKGMIDPRSEITATIYLIEVAPTEEKKAQHRAALEALYQKDIPVLVHDAQGVEKPQKEVFKYKALAAELQAQKDKKSDNLRAQAAEKAGANAILAQMKHIEELYRTGLTPVEIGNIKTSLQKDFKIEIKQIHVKDVDLVDRCESCHVGIRQPVPEMTSEALIKTAGADEKFAKAFAAHPKDRAELLKIHDPERFGCSPCHGGNGVGTTNIEKAHGRNEHWLYPMYDKENTEAGCLQCHQSELRLEGGATINAGKELFRHLGCWGCHPRDGFRASQDSLNKITQDLKGLVAKREQLAQQMVQNKARADDDETPKDQKPMLREANRQITLQLSVLEAEEAAKKTEQGGYIKEYKRPGPNLKNARAKLNRDWIPAWLADNKNFRPTTRMPQFRLSEDQRKAIAAFIWQQGYQTAAPKMAPGDAEKGQELFLGRGCLACHTATIDDAVLGGGFASDLSREGEKANYDYLVQWVSHPDRRLVPYNREAGRDCTPEETKTLAADDPAWTQSVIMPNLRLSEEDARDIASYLITLKKEDAKYEKAEYMDTANAALLAEGKKWVKHYGCAGCHEIAGLENENGIGTDLTQEGSKPIDRLDFGLLTHEAELGKTYENDDFPSNGANWYTHKGFFQRKLKRPEVFDVGKEKAPEEKLKMPNFGLKDEEIKQLTTFLLGSVDSNLPPRFYNHPEGYKKDIAEGWWVVQKYNCIGCHQIMPGEKPPIQKLPAFDIQQGGDIGLAPPNLVGEGARVNPEWLARFLRNPALSTSNVHRNGVRPYLQVRMPTFSLSENEIQKLVRFFNALSEQPTPYIRPQFKPLDDSERAVAREAMKAVCVRCHASGDLPSYPPQVIAPNLGFAYERLKPEWIDRWVVKPSAILPGTNMPDELFTYNEAEKRWVAAQLTPGLKTYAGDHRALFVRYLLELNPDEAKVLNAGP